VFLQLGVSPKPEPVEGCRRMGEFRRIDASPQSSGNPSVTIVEFRDQKLTGATQLQELAEDLASLLEQIDSKNVLLDLAHVEFISSAALNRLINFQKRVRESGGQFKLCCLPAPVESVFAATRLNQLFEIFKSKEEALSRY
jgi:anti-anti-sigma factor